MVGFYSSPRLWRGEHTAPLSFLLLLARSLALSLSLSLKILKHFLSLQLLSEKTVGCCWDFRSVLDSV
jgi:hypothetical protein